MTYDLALRDALITISPITDVVPLPQSSPLEVDLICLSGYHVRSYLTFVKEYLPCDIMKLREIDDIRSVFSVKD